MGAASSVAVVAGMVAVVGVPGGSRAAGKGAFGSPSEMGGAKSTVHADEGTVAAPAAGGGGGDAAEAGGAAEEMAGM